VLSSITVAELTYQSLVVQGNTFAPFEVFAVVACTYWIISIGVAKAAGLLERKAAGAQTQAIARNSLADSFLSLERRPAS
jgi:ABC-type amino acid transport system permease subunit